jgi:CheY-like chemotaxis protein
MRLASVVGPECEDSHVPEERRYTVMVIEDQVTDQAIRDAFTADRALGTTEEPYLVPLDFIARNADDGIEQLAAMAQLPDAILLDDFLPEGGETFAKAVEIMSWLCRRCISREIPLAERPRIVLWTRSDPELAYTFCALGGLQVRDKRGLGGDHIPVDAIWAALAGLRWQPEPTPVGLEQERHRAPLPWMEAGWQKRAIGQELAKFGVDDNTMETTIDRIRDMPRTPKEGSGRPSTATMAVTAAKENGWVWVPLRWHDRIPKGAPLPLVIDPDAHRESLPAAGPLPRRVQTRLRNGS